MKYHWRFQKVTGDGHIFIDLPASADLTGDDDLPCTRICLNGHPVEGALLEAVMDEMEKSAVFEKMRRTLLEGDSRSDVAGHKVENNGTRFASG